MKNKNTKNINYNKMNTINYLIIINKVARKNIKIN